MKRKLLYTVIFISIFLMSTASMVTPVQGYEPPDIPSEAKGMTLDDTEVVVYDEDAMEDSLGRGFDIKDIKDGDADIVGARSQMKIIDWETDDDLVEYEKVWVYEAVDFETSAVTIRTTLSELANATLLVPDDELPPIIKMIYLVAAGGLPGDPSTLAIGAADQLANTSISSWDVLMGIYAEEYDGTILEREIWDFLDPAEDFDPNDPDVDDDEVPYMLDPRDWVNSFYNVRALGRYITDYVDSIQAQVDNWYYLVTQDAGKNGTMHGGMAFYWPNALLFTLGNISVNYGKGINYPFGAYVLTSYILSNVKESTLAALPSKFGYLLQLLEAGQPCCGPAADFIKKAVEEFNIREGPYKIPWIAYGEDWLGSMGVPLALSGDLPDGISAIPYGMWVTTALGVPINMGGETVYVYANVDVEVDDAGTVTVEIEYLDDQQDPKDMIENYITPGSEDDPDELDDWEWVFPKGSDADTVMKDGDNVFYQTHPMEGPIPGYETPIILGVSLASVIGLIYVVMRKRKR